MVTVIHDFCIMHHPLFELDGTSVAEEERNNFIEKPAFFDIFINSGHPFNIVKISAKERGFGEENGVNNGHPSINSLTQNSRDEMVF